MADRTTGNLQTLSLETLILTAWCVYEDLTDTKGTLYLDRSHLHTHIVCSTTVYRRLIASLVKGFCQNETAPNEYIHVVIHDCDCDSIKISLLRAELSLSLLLNTTP